MIHTSHRIKYHFENWNVSQTVSSWKWNKSAALLQTFWLFEEFWRFTRTMALFEEKRLVIYSTVSDWHQYIISLIQCCDFNWLLLSPIARQNNLNGCINCPYSNLYITENTNTQTVLIVSLVIQLRIKIYSQLCFFVL